MWDLVRIVGICMVIVLLLKRKIDLGWVMLVAAGIAGITYGMGLFRMARVVFSSITAPDTLNLAAALILILFLENIMRRTGALDRMTSSLRSLVRDGRAAAALFPLLIGFLPSAGGAVFSAPMVEEVTQGLDLAPERRAFINFWYRHQWEYFLPIYSSIILTSKILRVSMGSLVLHQWPLMVFALVAGLPGAFRGMPKNLPTGGINDYRRDLVDFFVGAGPVLAVLVLVLSFKLDVSLALLITVTGLFIVYKYPIREVRRTIIDGFSISVVLLVFGIMIFKGMLAESGAVSRLPGFFTSLGIPAVVVIFVLPFTVGFLTGIASAFVAVTFPIIGAMLAHSDPNLRLIAFAYASGYAGVMLSPAHLCFILTVKYFKADFAKVNRMIWTPMAAVVLAALAIYLFG